MFKTILLPLSGQEADQALLRAGFGLARAQGAFLKAFFAVPDPRDMMAFVGEGMTAPMIDQVLTAAEKDAQARMSEARQNFIVSAREAGAIIESAPAAPGAALYAELVVETARMEEAAVKHARLSDLIVAPQMINPDDHEPLPLLRTLLRDTGRPVLILPQGWNRPIGAAKAAVAWNGSSEGARALASSLPFLAKAQSVTILTVAEKGQDLPGSAVVAYLRTHGIQAENKTVTTDAFSTGHTLVEAAHALGADMLVSGAYSRSRMSRLIFGGVTGYLLEHADMPLFMQH